MLAIILALLVGTASGIITGLTPGVHVNLVSALLLAASPVLLSYVPPTLLVTFILAMAITHTFLDGIPSTFLGASEEATLPAHRLVREGKGHEAVRLLTEGSLLCLILGILLTPVFAWVFPRAFALLKDWIGWILLGIVIWLVLRERDLDKKFWSAVTFLAAGTLGVIVLNMNLAEPLLPMLSGLFGVSSLLLSFFEKTEFPKQRVTDQLHPPPGAEAQALGAGTLAGATISLLPGLGPSQAATMVGFVFPGLGNLGYLVLAGGINTVNFLVSLVTMYSLQKARNGAMVVALELVHTVTLRELLLYLAVALTVGGLATLLTLSLARVFSRILGRVNYRMVSAGVLALVITLVAVFSGWRGLLILIISTSVGLIPQLTQTGKSHAMGCLLVPVILFFLLG
ncbi:MAG TPA: tripartite tricarboxylate transporter permease [Candidatus Binatia bacterium]|nr:tripartite tricarboxylate transporter permease [Candidatus Binatia bacterium]